MGRVRELQQSSWVVPGSLLLRGAAARVVLGEEKVRRAPRLQVECQQISHISITVGHGLMVFPFTYMQGLKTTGPSVCTLLLVWCSGQKGEIKVEEEKMLLILLYTGPF